MRRTALILLFGCAALLGVAVPAQAHNTLIGSDPEDGSSVATAPSRITLTFDQPVRKGFAQVTVTGPEDFTRTGKVTVDDEEVIAEVGELGPAGRYTVGYRVVSNDGHPISGKITFTLTTPAQAAETPAAPSPAVSPSAQAPVAVAVDESAAPLGGAAGEQAAETGGVGIWMWVAGLMLLLGLGSLLLVRRGGVKAGAEGKAASS